ncbi:hypothetical protein D9M68_430590 [compost metagenome]
MQLQEVDVIGAEPLEGVVDAFDQARSRRAGIIRPVAHRQRDLGRNQHGIAPSLDRGAEHALGGAVRVDVGRVEEVDAGFQRNVDQSSRFGCVAVAPGAEKRPLAAEGPSAEAPGRHLQSR